MLLHDYIEVPEWASLGFIALSLAVGVVVSLQISKKDEAKKHNNKHWFFWLQTIQRKTNEFQIPYLLS